MLREEGILAVLDALGCGGLILDGNGRVLQTNDKARRYLGSELDVRRRGAALNGTVAETTIQAALRNALRASSQLIPQLGDYITVPRPMSRPLLLRSILVPGDPPPEGGATAALIVLDMEDCPQPDEELLQEVFLMTPAETRLARRLSRGENLTAIAQELRLSIGTLRVQLKSLFLKTGTRRQGELIALLAHLTRLNSENGKAE